MLYYIESNYTCSSLVEGSSLVNTISRGKLFLWNLVSYFIVSVYIYFDTTAVEYLYWSTYIEYSLIWEIQMEINHCEYTRRLKWNIFALFTSKNLVVVVTHIS